MLQLGVRFVQCAGHVFKACTDGTFHRKSLNRLYYMSINLLLRRCNNIMTRFAAEQAVGDNLATIA